MGQRRMFSNRIANSAKFLQMPVEAQLLYFHMILRADDDGIVEAYPLMKLLGSAPDVFKVLLAKGFLRQLNEDQVVVITDWLEHNVIRADRKVNSIYLHLLKENAPDIKIVQPKPRSDVGDNSQRIGGPSTDGLSQVKLRQDKISKDNTVAKPPDEINLLLDFFKQTVNEHISFGNKTERKACADLLKTYGLEKTKQALLFVEEKRKTDRYLPVITTPYELWTKWAKIKQHLTTGQATKKGTLIL